jgi:hypothetical protein
MAGSLPLLALIRLCVNVFALIWLWLWKINRQRNKPTWAPFFNLKLKCSHWWCSASDSLSSPRVTPFSRLASLTFTVLPLTILPCQLPVFWCVWVDPRLELIQLSW